MHIINDLKPGVPVILADGLFPENEQVLAFLDQAELIICCDGATLKLLHYGLKPSYIVGDMDSLPQSYREEFEAIISDGSDDQDTNDLTKAVHKALELGLDQVMILGATGEREDHTLGNIGLLVEHGGKLTLQMMSDFGLFTPLYHSAQMCSFPGQQVSIFTVVNNPMLTTQGLKYPISNKTLTNWWCGTLNEALSDSFRIAFSQGGLVVMRSL